MALSKIKVFFPRLCVESYIPCNNFKSFQQMSVNISLNSLRQNLLNLVSSPTLIWYLKVDRQFKTLKNRQLTTILMISEHTNSKSSEHHLLHTS